MANILVVDDEAVVCGSVERILKRNGHETECVLTAKEGLDLMQNRDFDLVITDLMLPKMSGMDLMQIIHDKKPSLPIIMITGYATVKNAVQALKIGAFDFIPKPFTPEELRSAVTRALERSRLKKESISPLPDTRNMYGIPEHSWIKIDNGEGVAGVDPVMLKTISKVISIEFPFKGDELSQGGICARLISKNRKIYAVWSPLSGKVTDVHYRLNQNIDKLETDAYGEGWLLKIEPTLFDEEVKNLKSYQEQTEENESE